MGIGSFVKGVTKGAGKAIGGAGKAIGGAAKDVGRTAGKAANTVGHAAGDVAKGAGKAASSVGKTAGKAASGVGKTAGQVGKTVGKAGKGAVKVIGKAATGAAAGAKSVGSHAAGAAGDVVKGAGKVAGGVAKGGGAFVDVVRHAATGHFKDIPKDLKRAGKSFFASGKALVGVAESAGQLYLWTNGSFVSVVVAGSAGANALVEHRSLTAKERGFCEKVFADKVPYNKVVLTNLHSNDDRAFTIPNVDGDILVNLGPAYKNPLSYTSGSYPTAGQLLVHEMTHAWQIAHSKFLPGLICEGALNQTKHTILKTKGVYDPGTNFTKKWSSFNAEQQGSVIDGWFMATDKSKYGSMGGGAKDGDARFHYVRDNIRTGKA